MSGHQIFSPRGNLAWPLHLAEWFWGGWRKLKNPDESDTRVGIDPVNVEAALRPIEPACQLTYLFFKNPNFSTFSSYYYKLGFNRVDKLS